MTARRLLVSLVVPLLAGAGLVAGAGTASATEIDGGVLTPGTSVTATLGSQDRITYRFAATAGRHLTVDVTDARWDNNNPGAGNVFLELYDPSGVKRKTCAFENARYFCDITPATSGTWTARLVPGVAARGYSTFALWPDAAPAPITPRKAFTTVLAHQGSQARYTFSPVAGKHVTFDTSALPVTRLVFFDPSGVEDSHCTVTASYCDLRPAVGGTWTAAFIPLNGDTGTTTTTYAPDIAGARVSPGTPTTVKIALQGQNASYPWRPVVGQESTITVSALSLTGGTYVYLETYDASLTRRSSCILSRPSSCRVTPTTGGTWTIFVNPDKNAVGTLTFTVS